MSQDRRNNRGNSHTTKRISKSQLRRKRQLQYKALSWTMTAVFVVIFYGLICLIIGQRKFFKNTYINGIDVGKMKASEASLLVENQLKSEYSDASLMVEANGTTYSVDVSEALCVDGVDAAENILKKTHSFWKRGYYLLKSNFRDTECTVYPDLESESKLKEIVSKSSLGSLSYADEEAYSISDNYLILTKGSGCYVVNQDKLVKAMSESIDSGDYDTIIECPVSSTDVDIDAIYESIYTEPQEPTLDSDNDYQVVDAVDGISFDLEAARAMINAAKVGDEVKIPLINTPASMSTSEYESKLFADQLSTYSTYVEGSDNRKSNVRLAAEFCDETILMPGERFSYNQTLGETTEERGFLPGPAYANGESILQIGGGICQVSSTLYNACLYANLEINERHCHPYPSSYAPAGIDATVAWGSCDYIFTNNTDYPIKIYAKYDGSYVTCTIMGTITEPFKVEMYTETVDTEEYETEYKLDESLGEDDQILDTTGINGLTIKSYRRVYDGSGNVIYDQLESTSVYSTRNQVYRVGKLPEDKEEEESTETEEDSSQEETTEEDDQTEDGQSEDGQTDDSQTDDGQAEDSQPEDGQAEVNQ
jgi:vancomycin resistance protein YoaR